MVVKPWKVTADCVLPDSDRREFVHAVGSRRGGKSGVGAFIGEGDCGAADVGAGGVGHGAEDGAGIDLGAERRNAAKALSTSAGCHRQRCSPDQL